MRKYLSTLHKRSPKHKKRFALLASGGFTLIIFAVWVAVNFGSTVLPGNGTEAAAKKAVEGPNPFGSLMRGLESSFESLRDSLKSVELKSGYENMKNNSLNIYGR
ncbi:MAG: hypothetical protein A3J09_00375 [Candidatus Zambryskibacteria bacterium RIFCSPLOWO2_02_FULL_51_21]|uniref:Uncharacterized protein n=1 Tax=Candidatus Zambryskibacteria bacterium RIFCSPHIGHO2_02_FULL_43_37 TaxID=1802749 RepID=A0A1G2TJP7_9BACT|nr:MAG: hypothetical protein A2723_00375 [Candidatus Zambryskibacteria bacterium RIFCSPHIGHO2_01_FULL_52_18]OHA96909.1 MAG: hypothetical protein A3D49_02275 [Candidatus Zambryskibacteria bacterium RIFCSPHIGHO2_02_FULL_43_37]OHB07035.1 MAG: hypothetical protein A2944_02080 [Candidatus Zambryskibacteria bacterium RIFCSPLOWO2_01_FULL_52_12]OHB11021.1 MAG: hypothetical protein A3J09_00375 [Candidatus Zambryskibacteria bacterium RIFCSPLOWO2_02_FULL_51_21]